MDLKPPKRKRVGPHIKPQQPFPILIESENGISAESGVWTLYIGTYTGDKVIVKNREEMIALYTMGYFGKGSLSRGFPSFELTKKGIPPLIKERQWQRRKCWIEKIKQKLSFTETECKSTSSNINNEEEQGRDESDKTDICEVVEAQTDEKTTVSLNWNDEPHENLNKSTSNIGRKVLVIADSDDEDLEKVLRDPQPHLEDEEIKTVVETLHLTLEEAFFLCYALGCLQVIDLFGKVMSILDLWQSCCEVNSNFIESYAVYHYYRSKGWVVKSGYKFGGDFLLYKQGPPFYHASYIVLVEKLDSEFRRLNKSMTWTKLHGLNRLAENSGKDIIVCQVLFPEELSSVPKICPKSISKLQINEILNKRWISAQEREEKEQS